MKKILFFFSGALLFASCQELPKEAMIEQMKNQCKEGQYKTFVGKDASEETIEKFCDCYVSIFDAEGDTISLKDVMQAATKKENQAKIQECAGKAKETIEDAPSEVDEPKVVTNEESQLETPDNPSH